MPLTSAAIASIVSSLISALCALSWNVSIALAQSPPVPDPASFVQSVLSAPAGQLDFEQAKLAIDKFVDPTVDVTGTETQLDGMVATVRKMIATLPPEQAVLSMERMKALRAFIYQAGHWNDGNPFQYDLTDPLGEKLETQLLSTYLRTKKGNCVSMPMLFLVLGERIGLDVTLSTAPLHVFIKYRDSATGTTYNLEATSGAGFTRDVWYQQKLPMTDKAIASGAYMKTLSRKEAMVVMATLVLDHLLEEKHYQDAIAVADVLLEAWPEDVYVLAKKGTAYYGLLQTDIIQKYPKGSDIPADKLDYAHGLYEANQAAFKRAEELGWTPTQ